jgi:hypothetical protein
MSRLLEVAGVLPKPVEQIVRIVTDSVDAGPADVRTGPLVGSG